MRVTVSLLREHVHINDLAFLIESYIQPEMKTITGEWYPSLTSGHMEHLQECLTEKKHLDRIMMQACAIGDLAMIERLIALGEKDWNTGFLSAKCFNQVEVARIMISNGADVNLGDGFDYEYVRVGAYLNDLYSADLLPMYELLLNNGFSNLNELITPIATCDSVGLFNLIKPRITPALMGELMLNAVVRNSINLVKHWIEICGQSEFRRNMINMIIKLAGTDESVDIIKYLLTEGADPNNAISHACELDQKDAMRVLFAAGATCTCGKSRDAHIDEYPQSNSDEIAPNQARGLKRPRENEGDD